MTAGFVKRVVIPAGEVARQKDCPKRRVYTVAMEKIKIEHHTVLGGAWFAGWLFTIGFLQLGFWKGVLALVLWPYYLGVSFTL